MHVCTSFVTSIKMILKLLMMKTICQSTIAKLRPIINNRLMHILKVNIIQLCPIFSILNLDRLLSSDQSIAFGHLNSIITTTDIAAQSTMSNTKEGNSKKNCYQLINFFHRSLSIYCVL